MLLFALSLLAGCDIGLETIGCDFREDSVSGSDERCQDRGGLQSGGFDGMCDVSGGIVIEGGCPMDGVVAGCTLSTGGGDITDWYYAPHTLEDVELECEGAGTVVEP